MMSIYKGRLKNEYGDFSDDLLRYAQSGVILARQFVYGID